MFAWSTSLGAALRTIEQVQSSLADRPLGNLSAVEPAMGGFEEFRAARCRVDQIGQTLLVGTTLVIIGSVVLAIQIDLVNRRRVFYQVHRDALERLRGLLPDATGVRDTGTCCPSKTEGVVA